MIDWGLEIYLNRLLFPLVPPYSTPLKAMHANKVIHILHHTRKMESLKKHLPVLVPEGLNKLQIIVVRFEEKMYAAATSQVI